jgi:hypothetical protein
MKTCKICNTNKLLKDFYIHPKTADGYLHKCKDCCKIQAKERFIEKLKDPVWKESERIRNLEKSRLKERKTSRKKGVYKEKYQIYLDHKEKFPEKYKIGKMLKHYPKKSTHHLHHWSYNEEHFNDCIELTPQDHKTIHKYIIYDQERFMYRRNDNMELLDNKKDHEEYIKQKLNK